MSETKLSDGAKMALLVMWRVIVAICAVPIVVSAIFAATHLLALAPLFIMVGEFGTLTGLGYWALALIPTILFAVGNELVNEICQPESDGGGWLFG